MLLYLDHVRISICPYVSEDERGPHTCQAGEAEHADLLRDMLPRAGRAELLQSGT